MSMMPRPAERGRRTWSSLVTVVVVVVVVVFHGIVFVFINSDVLFEM